MNLSEQGNMFTETSFGENLGEIKEESYMSDLDLVIEKLSVSPTPYESSDVGADGSSMSMVKSDVSSADLLLSALDSISITECFEQRDDVATDNLKADAFHPIGQADPSGSGQRPDEGKDTRTVGSSDLASIAEPSRQRDGEAEVLGEIDKTCKPNHSLIVYTSSRRTGACSTKSNQNHESPKPSRRRRIANKKSVLDLSSLQMLRRSRSSFSKRPRSSVWGYLGNILPDCKVDSGHDLNLVNEKKLRSAKCGKGKSNAVRDQTSPKSPAKSSIANRHISLRIKIGNKILGNATENFSTSGKDNPEWCDIMENKLENKVPVDTVSTCKRNLEKVMSPDASALTTHLDVRGTCDNTSLNTSSDCHQIISQEDGENLGASTENRCSDVGTSPDSEVINSVPDAPLCEKSSPDTQDSTIMSKICVSLSDVPGLSLSQKKPKKGKKKDKLHQLGDCTEENKLTGAETINNAKLPLSMGDVSSLSLPQTKSKKGKKKGKLHEAGNCSMQCQLTGAETTNNAGVHADLGVGQQVGDVAYCSDATVIITAKPNLASAETSPSALVASIASSNLQPCDTLIACSNGQKFPKCAREKAGSNGRSRSLDLPSKNNKTSRKKGNKSKVVGKRQVNEKAGASGVLSGVESFLAAGNQTPSDLGETGTLSKDLSGPINSLQSSGGVREQYIPQRNAWVLCDECQKWRRIPASLADQIEETNCGWTCKDNMDKDFADCSIPQEKSNSEINKELEISDASCEEDAYDASLKSNQSRSKVSQQSSWSLIKSNLFLHRSRKTQTIDEVMVCHCKPPSDGRMGCGTKCLNRMLNIECVRGTCPCGELCSNQQFQKRKYAKLKWLRCGKKGYGLQALEDISEGQFLIEYVGEVLDVHAYEARQREYALKGHKHFYFMTLNGSEVIDACAKGNLGRYINHSCDPNCRTEKWMVNGEVCVGLFSLRDIKKGEEVTFDYNYVRVFGAAAKKCVCGSPNCRGYIGGDPTNSEVIVQDDSDDEYSEPVMICDDREMNEDWKDIMSNSLNDREKEIANEPPKNRCSMKKLMSPVGESVTESQTSETLTQKVEAVNSAQVVETMVQDRFKVDNSAANAVKQLDLNKITSDSFNGSVSDAFEVETKGFQSQMAITTESPGKSLSGTVESKRQSKYATVGGSDELAKSNSLAKINRSASSIKKGKLKTHVVNDKPTSDMDKFNVALHKSKRLSELPLNSHFEAVEEKLNELLDPEGGISKRRDASRGYLKLLFLTAASGNNGHGEAIQSNRDLSMILDALLKTKSRNVLVDIINKNGLQMLHNIMKRYRKEFFKTPILRKLLKVLEHLAQREILTMEHIAGGPPCPGVESLKDSILTLTEHADKEVHQIARKFRDKWIPKSLRKNFFMDRDDERSEFHQPSSYGVLSASYDHWSDRGGKPSGAISSSKKQPVAATTTVETSSLDLSASGTSTRPNGTTTRKRKSRWDTPAEEHPHSKTRTNLAGENEKMNMDDDIPPGFSSPCHVPINHQEKKMHIKHHQVDIILGDLQPRFTSRMPVSYGVPNSIMQQFGALQGGVSGGWIIAPGMPFHPFPPLPPYARRERDGPTSASRCASMSEPVEKAEQHVDNSITYSFEPPEKNASGGNGRPDFQNHNLGRKFFRQQKFNYPKLAPPWVRMRDM